MWNPHIRAFFPVQTPPKCPTLQGPRAGFRQGSFFALTASFLPPFASSFAAPPHPLHVAATAGEPPPPVAPVGPRLQFAIGLCGGREDRGVGGLRAPPGRHPQDQPRRLRLPGILVTPDPTPAHLVQFTAFHRFFVRLVDLVVLHISVLNLGTSTKNDPSSCIGLLTS